MLSLCLGTSVHLVMSPTEQTAAQTGTCTRKHKAFKCNLSSVISFGSLSPCYTGCIHCLSLPFALGHVLPSSCVLPSRVLGLEEFLVIYFCF